MFRTICLQVYSINATEAVGEIPFGEKVIRYPGRVSSDENGMCYSYKISHTAVHVSSIIKPKVLCAILNKNSSPQNAIPVDQYLKLMRNRQLRT
jgi:hypothetical protein